MSEYQYYEFLALDRAPAAEKDKLLTMVADGEGPQVQALLRRRFRDSRLTRNSADPPAPARTAAQLRAAAGLA